MTVDDIKISGDDFELTDAITASTRKKMSHLLSHYSKYITHFNIVLKIDNQKQHIAEANVHVPKEQINATAKTDDMYDSIDKLITQLKPQLERYKEEHLGHQK